MHDHDGLCTCGPFDLPLGSASCHEQFDCAKAHVCAGVWPRCMHMECRRHVHRVCVCVNGAVDTERVKRKQEGPYALFIMAGFSSSP